MERWGITPYISACYAAPFIMANISSDPAMRMTAGGSSGGICAFTLAFLRPDMFGKWLSREAVDALVAPSDASTAAVRAWLATAGEPVTETARGDSAHSSGCGAFETPIALRSSDGGSARGL